jgi:hypothetical protein
MQCFKDSDAAGGAGRQPDLRLAMAVQSRPNCRRGVQNKYGTLNNVLAV